jgi:hypothetical protein
MEGETVIQSVASIRVPNPGTRKRRTIMLIILLALLVLILFGAGFAVHLLWIAAVVLAVVWVASFALGRGEGASRRSLRR